jgi:hypothetical protein
MSRNLSLSSRGHKARTVIETYSCRCWCALLHNFYFGVARIPSVCVCFLCFLSFNLVRLYLVVIDLRFAFLVFPFAHPPRQTFLLSVSHASFSTFAFSLSLFFLLFSFSAACCTAFLFLFFLFDRTFHSALCFCSLHCTPHLLLFSVHSTLLSPSLHSQVNRGRTRNSIGVSRARTVPWRRVQCTRVAHWHPVRSVPCRRNRCGGTLPSWWPR